MVRDADGNFLLVFRPKTAMIAVGALIDRCAPRLRPGAGRTGLLGSSIPDLVWRPTTGSPARRAIFFSRLGTRFDPEGSTRGRRARPSRRRPLLGSRRAVLFACGFRSSAITRGAAAKATLTILSLKVGQIRIRRRIPSSSPLGGARWHKAFVRVSTDRARFGSFQEIEGRLSLRKYERL